MSILGKIVVLDASHGYGFIEEESHNDRIFFHVRDLEKSQIEPHVNELVEFDVESDLSGCLLALNISPSISK
jgi:CspA family cold shock protein